MLNTLVAPHVGAWIETEQLQQATTRLTSHPMWVRGLKLCIVHIHIMCKLSHPMWVRGLKQRRLATIP